MWRIKNADAPRLFHGFSGPAERPDGLGACIHARGWSCCDLDNIFGDDLCDDAVYADVESDHRCGVFDASAFGPPCRSFSGLRGKGQGPRPVRSLEFPEGLPSKQLTNAERELVKVDNLLAKKTALLCKIMHGLGRSFLVENPPRRNDQPTLWDLPDFMELAALPGVEYAEGDQCPFGAETQKPTGWLYFKVKLDELPKFKCTHPLKWWTDENGKSYRAAHQSLVGRWRTNYKGERERASRALAAYPSRLNDFLARRITEVECLRKRFISKGQVV